MILKKDRAVPTASATAQSHAEVDENPSVHGQKTSDNLRIQKPDTRRIMCDVALQSRSFTVHSNTR